MSESEISDVGEARPSRGSPSRRHQEDSTSHRSRDDDPLDVYSREEEGFLGMRSRRSAEIEGWPSLQLKERLGEYTTKTRTSQIIGRGEPETRTKHDQSSGAPTPTAEEVRREGLRNQAIDPRGGALGPESPELETTAKMRKALDAVTDEFLALCLAEPSPDLNTRSRRTEKAEELTARVNNRVAKEWRDPPCVEKFEAAGIPPEDIPKMAWGSDGPLQSENGRENAEEGKPCVFKRLEGRNALLAPSRAYDHEQEDRLQDLDRESFRAAIWRVRAGYPVLSETEGLIEAIFKALDPTKRTSDMHQPAATNEGTHDSRNVPVRRQQRLPKTRPCESGFLCLQELWLSLSGRNRDLVRSPLRLQLVLAMIPGLELSFWTGPAKQRLPDERESEGREKQFIFIFARLKSTNPWFRAENGHWLPARPHWPCPARVLLELAYLNAWPSQRYHRALQRVVALAGGTPAWFLDSSLWSIPQICIPTAVVVNELSNRQETDGLRISESTVQELAKPGNLRDLLGQRMAISEVDTSLRQLMVIMGDAKRSRGTPSEKDCSDWLEFPTEGIEGWSGCGDVGGCSDELCPHWHPEDPKEPTIGEPRHPEWETGCPVLHYHPGPSDRRNTTVVDALAATLQAFVGPSSTGGKTGQGKPKTGKNGQPTMWFPTPTAARRQGGRPAPRTLMGAALRKMMGVRQLRAQMQIMSGTQDTPLDLSAFLLTPVQLSRTGAM
jgi:hypothetical protein